jgi:hypothetical protein
VKRTLGLLVLACLAMPASASAVSGFESTFDASGEGWRMSQSSSGATPAAAPFLASGGNPGGRVEFTDTSGPDTLPDNTKQGVFVSPTAWAGDLSGAYGQDLSFEMQLDHPGINIEQSEPVVVMRNSAGIPVAADLIETFSGPGWNSFTVPLQEGSWTFTGTPSQAQFQQALATFTGLTITADYRSGAGVDDTGDVSDLDNVSIGTPSSPITSTLTLAYAKTKHQFKGKLKFSDSSCVDHNKVTVFRKHAGPDRKVGSDSVDASGAYSVHDKAKPGSYYARASTTCGDVKSNPVTVH